MSETLKQGIVEIIEIHGKAIIPWSILRDAFRNLEGQQVFETWLVENDIQWIDSFMDDSRMFWKNDAAVMEVE